MNPNNVVGKKKFKLSAEHRFCIFALAPIMLIYTYLRFIPIVQSFYMSFFNWNLIMKDRPFVGLGNYEKLLTSSPFHTALTNTTLIAFGILLLIMPLSLLAANALAEGIRAKNLYETLYFLPVVMPMVPVTVIWKWILNTDYGLLNYFLSFFGIPKMPWLINPTLALVTVIILSVWKSLGYNMLIFSVGLKGISREYYEAAAIDGATKWRTFFNITLPLLKPITVYVSIMTLISGYNVFSSVYILASDVQGSPGYLVKVIVYDIIQNAFTFRKMGYASAEAVILFIIVLILTLIQLQLGKDNTESKVKK